MAGMPAGFDDLIRRKYDILQQQADASTATARAAANLDSVKAGLMPRQTAADIAKINADIGLTNMQTRWFGPTAQANIGLARANAFQSLAAGALTNEQSRGLARTTGTTDLQTGIYTPGAAPEAPSLSRFSFGASVAPARRRPIGSGMLYDDETISDQGKIVRLR